MFKSSSLPLQELTSNDDADRFIESTEPVWLFKHSSACSVSYMAMAQFNQYLKLNPGEAAMLVVQKHRSVSNHVAERFGVEHESPQLFLMRQGQVLWHASHGGITFDAMLQAWQGRLDDETVGRLDDETVGR